MTKEDAAQLSPTVLAFVGDSVQTLYVRTRLALSHDCKSGALHALAADIVNAGAQARSCQVVKELFTPEEEAIFKRARNTKTGSIAKNASVNDYRKATGLEAVLGFLYLTGSFKRLDELLIHCDKTADT